MEENLRTLDDHLGLYTLSVPVAPGTALPFSPGDGDGQIYTDGSYATFNAGAWKVYQPRKGVRAVLAAGTDSWLNTGAGWTQYSVLDTAPAVAAATATVTPLVAAAVAAKVGAEAAQDGAFAAAERYPDTAAGLLNTNPAGSVKRFFSVPVVGSADSHIIYRNDGGVAVEVTRIISAKGAEALAPRLKSVLPNGNLADAGAGANFVFGTPTIAPVSDSLFNACDCDYAVVLGNGEACYLRLDAPDGSVIFPGQWVTAGVLTSTSNPGVWPTLPAGGTVILLGADASQTSMAMLPVALDTSHRRYEIVVQNTLLVPVEYVLVTFNNNVAATMRVTGFGAAFSPSKPSGLDWQVWDPYETAAQNERLSRLEAPSLILKTSVRNGNLQDAGAGVNFVFGTPVIAPLIDPVFNALDCHYAAALTNGQGAYLRLDADDVAQTGPGAWTASRILMQSSVPNVWPTAPAGGSVVIVGKDGSQTGGILDAQVIDSTHRVYSGVIQNTLAVAIDYILLVANNNVAITAKVTGFSAGFSRAEPKGVDGLDWDPFGRFELDERLTELESGPSSADAPDALLPSSLHLVRGRPLNVYRDGFMASRELSLFDVAFVGANNGSAVAKFCNPQTGLDGNELSDIGAVRFTRRGVDGYPTFSRPVKYFSSAATKPAGPTVKILHIRDSLGQQNTITLEREQLLAAGVVPTYLGTRQDDGGAPCEARSSWSAGNLVNRVRSINEDGSGVVYALRDGAGSGALFTAVLSNGTTGNIVSVTIANPGSGYADNPNVQLVVSGGGMGINHRCILRGVVSGGAFTSVVVVSDTTGFTSVPAVTVPPNTAEYLALTATADFAGRWLFNPFLRPATPGEVAANDSRIINGYVFDFANYLARFGVSQPDIVQIGLMMNDATTQSGDTAAANVLEALTLIKNAIRAVSADIHIAIHCVGAVVPAQWLRLTKVIRAVLQAFNGLENTKIWVLGLHMVVHPKFFYGMNVQATDPVTGVQSGYPADFIHPETFGKFATAQATAAFVLNRI